MSAELRERLGDLADQVPTTPPPPDLWDRGRRYGRRRTLTQAVVACCCLLLLAAAVSTAWRGIAERDVAPAEGDTPGHLPERFFTPSPWLAGTEDAGPPGRLAVVHASMRRVADGWTGSHEYLGIVGISAVDGSSRFLDLPISTDDAEPSIYTDVVLSPDGTKVGFTRFDGVDAEGFPLMTGWGVYDTVTGQVRELEDPEAPEPTGLDVFEIEFTGDSRHVATVYSRTEPESSRSDELVVWDVNTGERIVAEGPGKYWLPSMGSGPSGVVWSRGRAVYTFDPESRQTTTRELPHEVIEASYAPGAEAFAYIADSDSVVGTSGTWRLFAGDDVGNLHRIEVPFEPRAILGWRDDGRVVVSDDSGKVAMVHLQSRRGSTLSLGWHDDGGLIDARNLANDLWANELVPGVRPADVDDPRCARIRTAVAVLVIVGLTATGFLTLIRWRRRVGP